MQSSYTILVFAFLLGCSAGPTALDNAASDQQERPPREFETKSVLPIDEPMVADQDTGLTPQEPLLPDHFELDVPNADFRNGNLTFRLYAVRREEQNPRVEVSSADGESIGVYPFQYSTNYDWLLEEFEKLETEEQRKEALEDLKRCAIALADWNFDGHLDFELGATAESGNGSSYLADRYLYSPRDKKFVQHPRLSQVSYARADATKRRVLGFSRNGCCYHEELTYRWRKTLLVLVKRVVIQSNPDFDGRQKITTFKRVGGEMKRVSEKMIPNTSP